MASDPRPRISPEEYLALERQAETKSEYLDGEIFAMTGASRRHNRIACNLVVALVAQPQGGCRDPRPPLSRRIRPRVAGPDPRRDYLRQEDGWLLTETDRREDIVDLPSVGARLARADVYDRVL